MTSAANVSFRRAEEDSGNDSGILESVEHFIRSPLSKLTNSASSKRLSLGSLSENTESKSRFSLRALSSKIRRQSSDHSLIPIALSTPERNSPDRNRITNDSDFDSLQERNGLSRAHTQTSNVSNISRIQGIQFQHTRSSHDKPRPRPRSTMETMGQGELSLASLGLATYPTGDGDGDGNGNSNGTVSGGAEGAPSLPRTRTSYFYTDGDHPDHVETPGRTGSQSYAASSSLSQRLSQELEGTRILSPAAEPGSITHVIDTLNEPQVDADLLAMTPQTSGRASPIPSFTITSDGRNEAPSRPVSPEPQRLSNVLSLPDRTDLNPADSRQRSKSLNQGDTSGWAQTPSDFLAPLNSLKDLTPDTLTPEYPAGSSADVSSVLKVPFASEKKNSEFRTLFRNIPSTEKLLDNYSCALSKDILLQGRMYVSEHHVCFYSNIMGYLTNITIPFDEIIRIEKKTTAVLFPNGMVIKTLHDKYTFVSFMQRDAAYSLIYRQWKSVIEAEGKHKRALTNLTRQASRTTRSMRRKLHKTLYRLKDNHNQNGTTKTGQASEEYLGGGGLDSGIVSTDDEGEGGEGDDTTSEFSGDLDLSGSYTSSDEEDMTDDMGTEPEKPAPAPPVNQNSGSGASDGASGDANSPSMFNGYKNLGPLTHGPTSPDPGPGANEKPVLDVTLPIPPGVFFSLVWGEKQDFLMKTFERDKLFDISPIPQFSDDPPTRKFSYTRPLNGPIGPKQTKCIITETIEKKDFDTFCKVVRTTQTPDVPSGGSFQVKSYFYISWGSHNDTHLIMTWSIEWTGRSFIKGPIEKGSGDGQAESGKQLVELVKEEIRSMKYSRAGEGAADTVKKESKPSRKKPRKKQRKPSGVDEAAAAAAAREASDGPVMSILRLLIPPVVFQAGGVILNQLKGKGPLAALVTVLLPTFVFAFICFSLSRYFADERALQSALKTHRGLVRTGDLYDFGFDSAWAQLVKSDSERSDRWKANTGRGGSSGPFLVSPFYAANAAGEIFSPENMLEARNREQQMLWDWVNSRIAAGDRGSDPHRLEYERQQRTREFLRSVPESEKAMMVRVLEERVEALKEQLRMKTSEEGEKNAGL